MFLVSTFFRTFNPADYTANSGARQENWEGDGNETAEGTGKYSCVAFYPRNLTTRE